MVKRTYTHLSKAWYAESNLKGRIDGLVDDIHIETKDGPGFTFAWYDLEYNHDPAMKLEIFEDSLTSMRDFRDLMDKLPDLQCTNPQPDEIVLLLESLGIEDATPIKR